MITNKPIDQITEADLSNLMTAAIAERKTLDYKQQLPVFNDAGKREFLADVSSFANTVGGDLVFGMIENAGVPTGLPGVQIADVDSEILRLDSIIRDGLSPRIRHTTKTVLLANGYHVLIIRSEQSWYGPHRVIFKGDSRFYGRTTNGKYELDVTDLRNAFLFANTVSEKISAFRSERIIALQNGETLVPLTHGPLLAIHCMPIESFGSKSSLDVLKLRTEQRLLLPMGRERLSGWGPQINFEGILCVANGNPPSAYTQVYRNGVIEAVGEGFLSGFDPNLIPSTLYEKTVLDYLPTCFEIIKYLGVNPPILVGLSLIGVRGATLATDRNNFSRLGNGIPINRDVLMLPAIIVEDLSAEPANLLKPTLDLVWNACGRASSLNFDDAGKWKSR